MKCFFFFYLKTPQNNFAFASFSTPHLLIRLLNYSNVILSPSEAAHFFVSWFYDTESSDLSDTKHCKLHVDTKHIKVIEKHV